MGQILHKRATTTHEIRNKIRQEQGTTSSIAKKYNIAYDTAKKCLVMYGGWARKIRAIKAYGTN